MPKSVLQILLGFLMLTFTVAACNSKKEGDKKVAPAVEAVPVTEEPKDTTKPSVEKPVKTTD